ncbi:MAG: ATP synthase subunit I [Bryobacteraceae bacterium]|nr:ATP synthase subunit I [Bryobacteraceae bacterium]
MDSDAFDYRAPVRRMERMTVALAVVGSLVAALLEGAPGALGFASGGAISYFNFRWLKRAVDSVGSKSPRGGTASAILLGLRYGLLGAAGYVIVNYLEVSRLAFLAGLLTLVAAAIAEACYQLVSYARTS